MRTPRAWAAALCSAVLAAGAARAAPNTPSLRLRLELPEIAVRLPHVELRLGPSPPDRLRLGQFDLGPPRVGLTLRAGHLDLGLTAGRQLARDGSAGLSLAAHLRLGAREGVNLTARYAYLIARDPASAGPESGALGPHGALSIPLGQRLALTAEGSFLGDAGALGTLGLTHRVAGDGGPGSWFLSGGLGLAFQRTGPDCGGARLCLNEAWSAAPAAILGVEGRF
jgi:hypothetical protein